MGGDQAAGQGVGIAGLALETVNNLFVGGGHIAVGLLPVAGRQPALFLTGEQVEGFQNILVCELDVAGAFLVKRGFEVAKLDVLRRGCAA